MQNNNDDSIICYSNMDFVKKGESNRKADTKNRSRLPLPTNKNNWDKGFKEGFPFWEAEEKASMEGDFAEVIEAFDTARNNGLMTSALYKSYAMTYRKLKDVEAETEILKEGRTRFRRAKSGNYETGLLDLQSQLEKARKKR